MIKIHDRSFGITSKSLKKFNQLEKIGRILTVEGIRYKGRMLSNVQKDGGKRQFITVNREGVKVIGKEGYILFTGLLWGYSGTGPRGLHDLLQAIKLNDRLVNLVAYDTPRGELIGTDWRLSLDYHLVTYERFVNGKAMHTLKLQR